VGVKLLPRGKRPQLDGAVNWLVPRGRPGKKSKGLRLDRRSKKKRGVWTSFNPEGDQASKDREKLARESTKKAEIDFGERNAPTVEFAKNTK